MAAAAASSQVAQATAPSQPLLPLSADQVVGHVSKTVDWYHHLTPVEQLPVAADNVVSRDRLHQQALLTVQLAFDFGRAAALILGRETRAGQAASDSDNTSSAGELTSRLDQAADGVAQRVSTLQSQLAGIDAQLPRARAKERQTLVAQRAELAAALDLAREVQGSIQNMQRFEANSIAGGGRQTGVAGQIADLEKSVPEARGGTRQTSWAVASGAGGGGSTGTGGAAGSGAAGNGGAAGSGGTTGSGGAGGSGGGGAATSAPAGAAGATGSAGAAGASGAGGFRPESAGVVALASEWFAVRGARAQLKGSLKETDTLLGELEDVRSAVAGEVRQLVQTSLNSPPSTDVSQLDAQKQALQAGAGRFKQLATVLVPLGEQGLALESARTTLQEWRNTLTARSATLARYLALRSALLLASIAVVLAISEVWRRATFRYLHDSRRRRQFLVLRRVVVGIALTLVIVFGLVSEVGSVATYVGFVTAGLAVALQNVILAIVAYFFLIGRYGVRVGDRITLAGVTGRVADIGLLRINLMELSGPDLHSTGRLVVLSNAVLFQPSALFKQIPGADYVWHTATLTVEATADVKEVHQRLKAAADEVYGKYRAVIERQHAVVQRFIDFETTAPQPEVRVHLTASGLECSVRYPVEPESSASVDQEMLEALRAAMERDSRFKLAAATPVTLKTDTV